MVKLEYPKNLRFSCNRCGICCGDTPEKTRHVLLLNTEAERLAQFVRKRVGEFAEKVEGKAPYVYETKKSHEGKCVFYTDSQCSVYRLRPLVCRFYPFELAPSEREIFRFRATYECPCISSTEMEELSEAFFRRLLRFALRELGSSAEFAQSR